MGETSNTTLQPQSLFDTMCEAALGGHRVEIKCNDCTEGFIFLWRKPCARMETIQIQLWCDMLWHDMIMSIFYLGSVDVLFIECFDPECGGWSVFFRPTSSPVVGPTGMSKCQHVCLFVCLMHGCIFLLYAYLFNKDGCLERYCKPSRALFPITGCM